jgi:molybdopterin/thiamine biosynthesis adenylyltransferase
MEVRNMLDQAEKKRYNRHLLLTEIGQLGQEKLKAARVLMIGAGGLGCPALQYLTSAGVGTIGIVDFDVVDVSNLQRQVLFTIDDLGENKAEVAAKRLSRLNDRIQFRVYAEKLTTKNALAIFEEYDLILDGTDNFSTRYLVNDASILTNIPLVYGSIYKFEGQFSVFNFNNGPSYRCLFPTPPAAGTVLNCSEIGVLGVLPGVIGTQMANEALKIILGIGEVLTGKLMLYNALETTYTKLTIPRSSDEIEKVHAQSPLFEEYDYDLFCGVDRVLAPNELNLDMFRNYINHSDYSL